MQDNLQRINEIPFLEIFARVGVSYEKNHMGEYHFQTPEGKISNGSYKMNEAKNAVFANGQTRPQGTPFLFVKQYYDFNERQTFQWFEEQFDIKSEKKNSEPNIPKATLLSNISSYII